MIEVQPAATAGPSLRVIIAAGKFHLETDEAKNREHKSVMRRPFFYSEIELTE